MGFSSVSSWLELEQSFAECVGGPGFPSTALLSYLHPSELCSLLVQTNPLPAKTVPRKGLLGLGELQDVMALILLKLQWHSGRFLPSG